LIHELQQTGPRREIGWIFSYGGPIPLLVVVILLRWIGWRLGSRRSRCGSFIHQLAISNKGVSLVCHHHPK
jgi:hypothetical protein